MFKSMGKKKLLTLVAVMTVAVTVMGSFAAWDTLNATSTSNAVTLRSPVTVTAGDTVMSAGEEGDYPKLTATANFTLENYDDTKMTFEADSIVIKDATNSDTQLDNNDFTINQTPAVEDDKKTATIKVTLVPKDTLKTTVAGHDIKIDVTGKLTKKN